MPLRYFCGFIGLWILLSTPALAINSEPAVSRLQAMASAVKSLAYSGKLFYQREGVLSNLAFQHDFKNGEERARLRRLSGQPLERARVGDSLFEAMPGPDVLRQGYPLPGLIHPGLTQMRESPYRFSLGAKERVADRSAQVVNVEALDDHRYSYKFWVDYETDLLLKSQTVSIEGKILEQFEFSELALGSQSIQVALDQVSLQVNVHPITAQETVLQFSPASWLPTGYQLVSALPSKAAGQKIYSLVYSDGLGSFSIFLELTNSRAEPEMLAISGPTIALGKDYSFSGGALRVTLVGEIPQTTGKTIIDALDVNGLKGLLGRAR
jgi:sigma-E factor negative regulatory protein RseB